MHTGQQEWRWGIIGPGKIAHKFAADLQLVPGARLKAVASRDQGRAEAFAKAYGAPYAYGRYEDILGCPELDVVYIATPHNSHCELSQLCIEAGKAVLCEKPWAVNYGEALEMTRLARARRVFLMEALWTRFLPTTRSLLAQLEQGAIGAVEGLKADFGFLMKNPPPARLIQPELGGGALLDIGIYPAFLSLLLLGYPRRIQAMARFAPTGIDLEDVISLQYAGGQLAQLHTSLLATTKTEAFIYGTEGIIHWHARWHERSSFSILREGQRPENFFFDISGHGYQYEAQAVQDCLAAGLTESPDWSLDSSLELSRLLDDIAQASRQGL
jgi:predicted dehydrogenase